MRLIIVSNRLPFTVVKEDGGLQFKVSSGGLTTGLWSYLEGGAAGSEERPEFVWLGWPGASVAPEDEPAVKAYAEKEFKAQPVFLPEERMDRFYHGFCNKTLWPLFHYFPDLTLYEEEYWEEYKQVNHMFAEAVLKVLRPDDLLWVHDYQLMLVPGLVRERFPDMPIGFFLHIPFPSYEVFRLLPRAWRVEIIEGLLGSSLVGFHTYDYTRDFLTSVLRTAGYEHQLGCLTLRERVVTADTFPMGIDFERFARAAASPETEARVAELRANCAGQKVIFSVDRLEQTVGRIVGAYGTVHWTPLVYQFRNLGFEEIVALYRLCDVALITPLRDGMNLVAKEFVASRPDQTGVLVLSEMAGAAKEMGEALIINPVHSGDFAQALEQALAMPVEEQVRRNRLLQERLRRYNVVRWAEDFVQALVSTHNTEAARRAASLSGTVQAGLLQQYRSAARRALLLDYDGTLVPFVEDPSLARPDQEVLELLTGLATAARNEVII